MAVIDVYVVDDSSFDLTMFIDSALTWGDIGVKNVRDMADKVTGLCSSGDRIAKLRIMGHGNDAGQYIGSDWVSEAKLPSFRAQFARLSGLFVRAGSDGASAELIMGGCQQGRNGSFLLAISNIVNVPVSGFTALQRPVLPGDEGGRTTCYITCARGGRTAADSVDDVQIKIMDWFR